MEESLTLSLRRPWLPWGFSIALTAGVTGLGCGLTGAWAGWIVLALSLPVLVWLGLEFDPRRSSLILTNEGLTVRRFLHARRIAWEWIESIRVARIGWRKAVVLDLKPGCEAASWRLRAARWRTGHDLCLEGAYGMSPDALAVLLKRWQGRHWGASELP